ncbi:MAG: GNAT family N-acetyltransferase [Candidatus Bathyarchaeota archaeon]|nr:GNAT family N-acetyltransferase [Candidatus Bathyarchaeota archaeon]
MNHRKPRITVELTREEHIEGYHKCLDSVARERRFLGMTQAPALESSRQFVLSNIAAGVPQYVAVAGDTVVGWIDITPRRAEPFKHCGALGMGVMKEHRGLGVGSRLIDHALSRAREIGLERVELEVLSSNTQAISLYEKNGFIKEGVKSKAFKLDGRYEDVIQMALFI